MEMTTVMRELREAAKDYAAVQAARDAALDRLQAAIRAADREENANRSEIVRLSGLARQTVYDALRGVTEPTRGRMPFTEPYTEEELTQLQEAER
jgi:DNA-binding phage protein